MIDIPELKKELRERGIKATLTDLMILAGKNDPFGVFTESRITAAEWAAQVWHMIGEPRNLHIRRVHYWTLASEVMTGKYRYYKSNKYIKKWREIYDIAHNRMFDSLLHAHHF